MGNQVHKQDSVAASTVPARSSCMISQSLQWVSKKRHVTQSALFGSVLGQWFFFCLKAYITAYEPRSASPTCQRHLIDYRFVPRLSNLLSSFFLLAHLSFPNMITFRLDDLKHDLRCVQNLCLVSLPSLIPCLLLSSSCARGSSTRRAEPAEMGVIVRLCVCMCVCMCVCCLCGVAWYHLVCWMKDCTLKIVEGLLTSIILPWSTSKNHTSRYLHLFTKTSQSTYSDHSDYNNSLT